MEDRNYWLQQRVAAARRRLTRRRFVGTTLIASGISAFLSACGGNSSNNANTGKPATTQAPSTTAATAAAPASPAAAGRSSAPAGSPAARAAAAPSSAKARVGLAVEPPQVDPHDSVGGTDDFYLLNIFNGLYEWGTNGLLVPGLADSVEIPADGSQVTFKLKQGVVFHNGDPFTAQDVAYSYNRVMTPSFKRSKVEFLAIDSVQTPDDQTVVYKLKKPDAGFVADGYGMLLIVPAKYTDAMGKDGFDSKPVGTGAYHLTSRTIGTGATFDRYDRYFRGPAGFASLEYKVIPDATARVDALEVGNVDVISSVPPELVKRIQQIKGAKAVATPSNTDTIYSFALRAGQGEQPNDFMKAIQDKRVRQAFNLGIDRQGIANTVYTSTDFAQPYAVTNSSQPFNIGKTYPFDPGQAKQLLSAASVSKLSVNIYQPTGRIPGADQMGAVVQSNLKDLGIESNLQLLDYNVFIARLRNDTPPPHNDGMIFAWATTGAYTSPFLGADNKWTCRSNYGQYCNKDFDALLDKARSIFDENARNDVVKQAFNLLYDEAPGVWLVLLKEPYGLRTQVIKDWTPRVGNMDRAVEIARRAGMELHVAAKVDAADREYYESIRPVLEEPHVTFLNEIGDADKCAFLSNAAALLFPIDWPEPFGLVMIEALSCGTPVIAFRGGAVEEIIEDGVTGYIVESIEEAVQAVERIPSIDRDRCRSEFERRFSASRMCDDYLRVYERVIEGNTANGPEFDEEAVA